MTEYASNPTMPFEALEQEVSAALVANDAVLELVRERLAIEPTGDLSSFMIRPCYDVVPPREIMDRGLDPKKLFPISLQIENLTRTPSDAISTVSFSVSTYSYLRLGVMARDSSQLFVYDELGRLHEVSRSESGFKADKRALYDLRRLNATTAWQLAHNRMLQASRNDPRIHLDPDTRIWTDRDFGSASYS
jgi:hypothetical protein